MRTFITTLAISAALAGRAQTVDDSLSIANAYGSLRSYLNARAQELDGTSDRNGQRALADSMEAHVEVWVRRVRRTWPDSDDHLLSYALNSGLVAAYSQTAPELASLYGIQAVLDLFAITDPFRPAAYAAVLDVQEQAQALAHARRERRSKRIRSKLVRSCTKLP